MQKSFKKNSIENVTEKRQICGEIHDLHTSIEADAFFVSLVYSNPIEVLTEFFCELAAQGILHIKPLP